MNKPRKTTVFQQPRTWAYHQGFVAAFCALLLTGLGTTELSAQVTITPKMMVDIYFIADTTGSMSSPISSVKAGATKIMNNLIRSFPDTDLAFGVGDYKDFPSDSYAFQSVQSLTTNISLVQTAINGWSASGGSDGPEAQLYALDRLANAPSIGWRTDAKQIVLWFGDCPGHDPVPTAATKLSYDITKKSVITDLFAAGIIVFAISTSTGCSDGMDTTTSSGGDYSKTYGITEKSYTNQATDISTATGGHHQMGVNSDVIVDTIKSQLSTVVNIAAETGQLLALECTQIPQVECKGLAEIYYRTKGYYWKESWSVNQTHCEWKGITCQNGHVTQIDLSANQLRGTLPQSIGYYFSQLSNLNLAGNQLTGSIPFSIGHLKQLQILALNNNQLSGPIPHSIGYMSQLQNLRLNDNQLDGPIPKGFGDLNHLTSLFLNNNQLGGPIPKSIGHLKKLTSLSLGSNQLSGPIPNSIGHLSQLLWLSLSNNQLSGPIPRTLGRLTQLKSLSLGGNQLSGPIPEPLLNVDNRENSSFGSYKQTLRIKPNDYKIWNKRGVTLHSVGRYQEAIESFDKALQINPDYYQAWNNRGIALRQLGRYQAAIKDHDKALQIKPDYYKAWDSRGNALYYLERYQEAIESYDKALQIKPDLPSAKKSRQIARKKLKQQ
jgi:tetratricopeptide (TPR) repeat protein